MNTISELTIDNNRCFACGSDNPEGLQLRFSYSDNENSAETLFIPDGKYQGWKDVVHGGILMTLMDETMAKAAVRSGLTVMTAEITAKFKNPAMVEQTLKCSASIETVKKRIVYARATIHNNDNTLIAEASGKLVIAR